MTSRIDSRHEARLVCQAHSNFGHLQDAKRHVSSWNLDKVEAPTKIQSQIPAEMTLDLVGHENVDWYQAIALFLGAGAALLLGLVLLTMRWNLPLLGMHSFRQARTAATSYWLIRGSPWFAYETPVFGAPWSTPFEFPFYQLLVAGLAEVTGLSLDSTGRLLSFLFLVLTIIPVRMLTRAWKLDKSYIRIFVILLLSSPIYLFWGTAFLIETFAVFFGFWYLAEVERTTRSSGFATLALAVFCGAVGALGKITTFVPFACIAGLILLNDFVKRLRRREPLLRLILNGAAVMGIPFILFEIWNRFTDAEKSKNPISAHMVSTLPATHQWFFGTWAQLFSIDMPLTLLRSVTDTLGVLAVPILIASIWLAISYKTLDRRAMIVISGAVGAFMLPFMLFTNVHIVHNYYDAANAIFLICAMAMLIVRLFSIGHRRAGWNLLAVTIASQLTWLGLFFVRDIRNPRDRPLLAIAQAIHEKTDPESVVVIYGQDYSSVIPYYAERRALMEPDSVSVPDEEVLGRAHHMLAPQGGHPIEAVVRCKSQLDQLPEFDRIFADLDTHLSKQKIAGCNVYFIGKGATR